ncbi:F-box only protein 21 isoform X1 [Diachasma alloeum]|uniref:F-box only protein 21 isoform X1 n=1 Tax=Diachasma alloeum TaxID=454923 RepID=UPI0007382CED|nr:F-box only protein 21 isoform X1 [Diachasma alloeum]
MAPDVLMSFLPCEVIDYILESNNIKIKDVINFGMTCKHMYRSVTNSNKLWRTKFFQRWPTLKDTYEKIDKDGYKVSDWMEEFHRCLDSRKKLMEELSHMSMNHYKQQELSHSSLNNFKPLFRSELGAHPMAYHFLIDELIRLIERPVLESNLTHKHYAYKIIRYLRQCYLADEWAKFLNLAVEYQTLEKGAVLVSQWSQPERHISYTYVASMLDNIADYTKQLIKEKHPAHPILSQTQETFNEWREKNISDNQWSSGDTRQVMTALCEVMFDRMLFHGNSEMYYSSENSFIDRVLENRRGIPITLAIVFESAARRLGVRCEAVSFPAHFLLRWKEKYNIPESEEIESFYIDVFNGGQFLTKNSCPRIGGVSKCPIERYNVHNGATAVEVVQRMANNLEVAGRQRTHLNGRAARLRSALELLHLVRPHDTSTILHLARFYILHQMDLMELVQVLKDIQKNLEVTSRGQANHILQMLQDYERHMKVVPEDDLSPKVRTAEIKYTIGMIMKHRTYEYFCVISGWDKKCEASPEWMNEMGIDELNDGVNQPFYYLFVDDGSSRYAAQENLIIAPTPKWINHDDVGRYFYKFCGAYYLPNEEKEREYPDDGKVRDQLLRIQQ